MTLKLGKKPARPGAARFRLTDYTLPVPAVPVAPLSSTKHQKLISPKGWGMLGNDQVGDCVFAGAAHETMLWTKEANVTVPFTTAAVLRDYSTLTGYIPGDESTDQGTDMVEAASYRRKFGVVDAVGQRHKIGAYLSIRPGDRVGIRTALYLFGAVGVGVEFPRSAMAQFDAGRAWSVVPNDPIDGGHYVSAVGYSSRYLYVVTWGQLQRVTWSWFATYCDEAVAYVSEEMLTGGVSPEHFNLTQLNADLAALPAA